METVRVVGAGTLFVVALVLALRTLQSGADGRWRGLGFIGSLVAFAGALWASLVLLGG